MRQLTFILLSIALVTLWGCSNDSGPGEPAETDTDAITSIINDMESSEDEDYFYSDLDDETEDNFMNPFQLSFNLEKPVLPIKFGRIARPIIRDIRIIFTSDTTATVLFRKIMRGRFVILAADTSDSDTAQVYRVKKKLAHEFQRVAHFVKREGETLRERWRLFEFSMGFGQSLDRDDSTTVKTDITIVKLLVEPSEGDTVEITDPLSFFQTKRSVFAYTPGTEVKLTVHVNNETNNPLYFPLGTQSTELVRLHHTRHRKHRFHGIKPFTYVGQDADGNNIYEGSWVIGNRFGVHHAVIDVIDNGTIHDDEETYPYSSTTWSSPYKVKMMN